MIDNGLFYRDMDKTFNVHDGAYNNKVLKKCVDILSASKMRYVTLLLKSPPVGVRPVVLSFDIVLDVCLTCSLEFFSFVHSSKNIEMLKSDTDTFLIN